MRLNLPLPNPFCGSVSGRSSCEWCSAIIPAEAHVAKVLLHTVADDDHPAIWNPAIDCSVEDPNGGIHLFRTGISSNLLGNVSGRSRFRLK